MATSPSYSFSQVMREAAVRAVDSMQYHTLICRILLGMEVNGLFLAHICNIAYFGWLLNSLVKEEFIDLMLQIIRATPQQQG